MKLLCPIVYLFIVGVEERTPQTTGSVQNNSLISSILQAKSNVNFYPNTSMYCERVDYRVLLVVSITFDMCTGTIGGLARNPMFSPTYQL